MQIKKTIQSLKEAVFKNERLLLALIFLFVIINWLLITLVEKIGPPDFYKIHEVAERLFSGDINIGIIMPLFPLLMYPLGKFIGLFAPQAEAFIIAGRIISLAASLGVLYLTYLFLKKITDKFALVGLLFFVISPWYLKLLAFPITDMLYLFFVTAAFYAFLNNSRFWWALGAITGGVMTRFEGVLLILSGAINYFKFKKRYFYVLLAFIPPIAGLLFFFWKYATRFFAHFKDVILPQKTYLYIFLHPLEFLNLIYGNILYFIPISYPYPLKMFLLMVVLALFFYGIFRLYKISRSMTVAIVVYELLFLVAKGYLNPEDPGREFRRIFSGLWIFYVICFIGCYFFLKKIQHHRVLRNIVLIAGGTLFIGLSISQELIGVPVLFPALLLILPLWYSLRDLSLGKIPKVAAVIILLVFAFQVYSLSYKSSEKYVDSYAPKAAYEAAKWLNLARLKENAVILYYTNNQVIEYYLKKKPAARKFQMVHFTVPMRNTTETRQLFIQTFFNLLKEHNVDYIIFDNYVVQKPEFLGINDVQRMLYEEKENQDLFRIKRNLFYKGNNVGYVLKPIDDQTNP